MPEIVSMTTWQDAERLARERQEHFFGKTASTKAIAELFPDVSDDASLFQSIFQVYCKQGPTHRESVPWFTPDPKDPMYQMRNIEKDRTNERSNAMVQKNGAVNFETWSERWLPR